MQQHLYVCKMMNYFSTSCVLGTEGENVMNDVTQALS